MEPGFAFVSAAAGAAALLAAGQIAVLRKDLRRGRSRATSAQIRQVRLVGPHAAKVAGVGIVAFALGTIAHVLGAVAGLLMMGFGLVLLGFAVANAVGLRMVTKGDPSWSSTPRSAFRDAALLGAGVTVAGIAILIGTRDMARLIWLVPIAACALVGFALTRAYMVRVEPGEDGP